MKDIEAFLKELQNAHITWIRGDYRAAIYDAVYKGETLHLRLNDFPDQIAFTLLIRGEEINLEESPSWWHLARR